MANRNFRRDFPWHVPLAALLVFGCGTSDYEQRMEARVKRLREEAVFNVLYDPTEITATPIMVRVPRKFTQRLVAGAEIAGRKVDARRATVPYLNLPGNLAIYEATVTDQAGGSLPYYIYVLAIPADQAEGYRTDKPREFAKDKDDSPQDVPEGLRMEDGGEIARDFIEKLGSAKPAWQDVECPTPQRTFVRWQRIRGDGPHAFCYLEPNNQERWPTMPGHFEVWARYHGQYLVLIGWHMPQSVRAASEMDTLAPLVAGTVTSR